MYSSLAIVAKQCRQQHLRGFIGLSHETKDQVPADMTVCGTYHSCTGNDLCFVNGKLKCACSDGLHSGKLQTVQEMRFHMGTLPFMTAK